MKSRGVNKAIIIGNLGVDPDIRYLPSGGQVTNIRVATSEKWRDKNTGEDRENTEWHRIVFFGKLAEIAGQYLTKGSQVYIEGRLQTRSWEQDGQKRYSTEIVANEMQMLGGRPVGAGQPGGYGGAGAQGGAGGYGSKSNPIPAGHTNPSQYQGHQGTGGPPPGGDDFGRDDIPFVEHDWRAA